jgi:general secretion pathway protein F
MALTSMPPTRSAPSRAVAGHRQVRLLVHDGAGSRRELVYDDIGEADAVQRAAACGLQVIEVIPLTAVKPTPMRRAEFALLLMTQELLALLEAGLNLTEALAALHAKEDKPGARQVLDRLLRTLEQGGRLSDALASMPQAFPDVYVATVRAAERTGDLPRALARFVTYQSQIDALRKKLLATALYPMLLLVVGGAVTLFLLAYVVPRFAMVYDSSGRDLPWLSAALLRLGSFIQAHGMPLFVGAAILLGTLGWRLSRPDGRRRCVEWLTGLPGLRTRADDFRLARCYQALSLLLASGIPLSRALDMAGGLLGTARQPRLAQCRLAIEQGRSLSAALTEAGLAGPIAQSLIRVGERSGQLADMLERAGRFADEDFSRWMDWASRLLEPLLMLVIGAVIGTVVVLMYLPIFELAGGLQ